MAANAMPIADVADTSDQCLVQAVIPSNLLSWKGRILVTLRTDGGRVHIEAATKIPGQMYDWGRSKRMLGKLFGDVDARAATFRERDL